MKSDVRKRLIACIANTLGHREVASNTDFFAAGLNSIGRTEKLVYTLSKEFGVPISIRDLREHPNIEALEAFLLAERTGTDHNPQADYPLTQTQLGILVETVDHPNATTYNCPLLLRVSDKLDLRRLKQAMEVAIAAHPYLSATITKDAEGNFRITRNDTAAPVVEIIDVPKLPEDLIAPFDVLGGRLYRAHIYSTDDGAYLFCDFHHSICDGTSIVTLYKDINAAYAGEAVAAEDYTGFDLALDEQTVSKMDAFNQTNRDWPIRDIVSMFRDAAAQFADRQAVSFGGHTYSYHEVDDLSERIACELRERGVHAGDLVSILVSRCEWMPVAALGALKAGAAYQPLDPSNPTGRLAFMMADAGTAALVADELLLSRVPDWEGPVLPTSNIAALPDRGRIDGCPDSGCATPERGTAACVRLRGTGRRTRGVRHRHRHLRGRSLLH